MSVCGSGRVFSCELKLNAIFFSGLLRSRAEMRGKDSEVYRWYKYTGGRPIATAFQRRKILS